MTVADVLERVQAVNPAALAEVVRQDQRDPSFDITDWTVARLSDRGIIHPDGLFRFNGHGRGRFEQATRPWSVVLKVLPAEDSDGKRECQAAESGLLASLPGPVAAPRCYGVQERDGGAWYWMEYVADSATARWTIDHYAFAARQFGRFNGAYLTRRSLPDYPWLCTQHARGWTEGMSPEGTWDNPFVARAFPPALRERVMRLWAERERFYAALDRLPQTFSHFDGQRRNLFIRRRVDGKDELVAVDWSQCGRGAIGGELYALVGMSTALFEWDVAAVAQLDAAAFVAYLAGLRDVGWRGDADLVRLGYTAWLSMHFGAAAPTATRFWTGDAPWWTPEQADAFAIQQFGRCGDALASTSARLCEYCMDLADEARRLMGRLKVG